MGAGAAAQSRRKKQSRGSKTHKYRSSDSECRVLGILKPLFVSLSTIQVATSAVDVSAALE